MATYSLPDLPYAYDALAPHISQETLELHHDKHHAAYVKGANETLDRLPAAEAWQVPGLERSLAFNVAGHALHSLFWECLSPEFDQQPTGSLAAEIDRSFGSFEAYSARFKAAITTVQGSGWALLVWEPIAGALQILQVQNHENALTPGATAILAADAWEHAFYVDYRNDKAAWADAFFHVTDWAAAGKRFESIAQG